MPTTFVLTLSSRDVYCLCCQHLALAATSGAGGTVLPHRDQQQRDAVQQQRDDRGGDGRNPSQLCSESVWSCLHTDVHQVGHVRQNCSSSSSDGDGGGLGVIMPGNVAITHTRSRCPPALLNTLTAPHLLQCLAPRPPPLCLLLPCQCEQRWRQPQRPTRADPAAVLV